MRIQFLGTAAAEGAPAAYCRCEACQGVRDRGGVEIKSRSSIQIDSEYQIDIPPDNYLQMVRLGIDMYDIRHLMISHSHGDHLSLGAIADKTMSREVNGDPLLVYLSEPAFAYVEQLINTVTLSELQKSRLKKAIETKPLKYFSNYKIGNLSAKTVAGSHNGSGKDEKSINYLLTGEDGTSMLYALDTGYYSDESFEYLEGEHTDALIMDCTLAGSTNREEFPFGHLDILSFEKMISKMSAIGFIDSETAIIASHLNPHQGLTHWEVQERFDASSYTVVVAYDGLSVDIGLG